MATAPAYTRRRNFWQLPTFVAGLAAAVAAYANFPPPPVDPATLAERDVVELRVHLARKPADLAKLTELSRKVADAAEAVPAADVSRLLAGTGYMVLAEYGPVSDTAANWDAAARLFAAVNAANLTDAADSKRLAYRQAKALAATGQGDPKVLAPALSNPPVGEDDTGERPRLLAEICLKLDPPDLKRVKAELTTYLGSPPRPAPQMLAKLKLTLGGVHAALNETEIARKWLNDIGTSATPDVQAAAKVQLARIAATDGNWADAVKLYEAALAVPGLPDADRGLIRYQTGDGLLKLKNPTAAVPYFEQALAEAGGPAATAAAVRLAEIALRDPAANGQRGKAVGLLETAVGPVVPGAEFGNPHVTMHEVHSAFEEAVQVCLNEQDYTSALRAAVAYAKVAPAGRDKQRRAEVNVAWATALQRDSKDVASAAAKLRDAANDYAALALAYPTPAGKADLLRKSADCFKKAGDTGAAIKALDRVIDAAGTPPELTAAAWLEKGELLLAQGKAEDAEQALKTAMAGAGPPATAARVKLALIHVERARSKSRVAGPEAAVEARNLLDLGQALLSQVANKPAETAAEREVQQQALFELGKLLLQQQNFADAEARFRQLIQLNPAGALVGSARLYLGSCLLLIARGDHQNGRPPVDADRKLAEAREMFQALADHPDPFLRTQADVRLANTTLLLKHYDEMPALCERLAEKYRGKVEELIVLSMLYTGQRYADRNADAARTLARMEDVFGKLQDGDFTGGAEEYTRDYWKRQWFDVLKSASAARE